MGIAIEKGFHSLVEVLLKNGFPADGKTLWEAVRQLTSDRIGWDAMNQDLRHHLLAAGERRASLRQCSRAWRGASEQIFNLMQPGKWQRNGKVGHPRLRLQLIDNHFEIN
jgi:hypothetical protein